jgi:hypothetical protein
MTLVPNINDAGMTVLVMNPQNWSASLTAEASDIRCCVNWSSNHAWAAGGDGSRP